MTTRYPLGLILIELSYQLAVRRMALRADWVPRLQNEEADALTNGDFRHFSDELEVKVDFESLKFGVLDRLLRVGEAYFLEVEAARSQEKIRKARDPGGDSGKRKKGDALRDRDPW
jgi:hypothetical protein